MLQFETFPDRNEGRPKKSSATVAAEFVGFLIALAVAWLILGAVIYLLVHVWGAIL